MTEAMTKLEAIQDRLTSLEWQIQNCKQTRTRRTMHILRLQMAQEDLAAVKLELTKQD